MKKIHEVKVAMAGEEVESCSTDNLLGAFAILAAGTPTEAANCLIELIFSFINQFLGTDLQS